MKEKLEHADYMHAQLQLLQDQLKIALEPLLDTSRSAL